MAKEEKRLNVRKAMIMEEKIHRGNLRNLMMMCLNTMLNGCQTGEVVMKLAQSVHCSTSHIVYYHQPPVWTLHYQGTGLSPAAKPGQGLIKVIPQEQVHCCHAVLQGQRQVRLLGPETQKRGKGDREMKHRSIKYLPIASQCRTKMLE